MVKNIVIVVIRFRHKFLQVRSDILVAVIVKKTVWHLMFPQQFT